MKLNALLVTAGACLLTLSTLSLAQTPVYRDGILSIPAGAVLNASGQFYYKDIQLQADSAGRLKVLAASPRPLVYIDSANPTVTETQDSREVTLAIAGNKSVPCVALEPVAISRKADTFTILVAETVQGPAESCIAVLSPFEITVPLDVSGLPAGTYKVVVNDQQTSFVLTKAPTAQ
jgi:hypothetical protein